MLRILKTVRRIAVLTLVALMPTLAFCDGIIVGYEEPPNMPRQRALIFFDGKVETLVVESHFQGKAGEYAWILPVPAKPTKIGIVKDGLAMDMASLAIGPRGVLDTRAFTDYLLPIMVLQILLLLVPNAVIRKLMPRSDFAEKAYVYVFVNFLFILAGLFFGPVFAGPSSGHALAVQHVGPYDVAIAGPKANSNPVSLLERSGFRLTEAAKAVISDDAKRGWHFVVWKLRRDKATDSAGPLLRVSFPTNQAIYPMRLTGTQAKTLRLELYVFAQGTASASSMEIMRSKEIHSHDDYETGKTYWWPVHIDELADLYVEGMWATQLRHDLEPKDLRRDISINIGKGEAKAYAIYTPLSAICSAIESASPYLIIGIPAVALIAMKRRISKSWVAVVAATAICFAGLWGLCTYPIGEITRDIPEQLQKRMGKHLPPIIW